MGEDEDDGPGVDSAHIGYGCEVVAWPGNDHSISRWETGRGGEDRSGIAHRDVEPNERPDASHRSCIVDGAEDEHPRRGAAAQTKTRTPSLRRWPSAAAESPALTSREQPTRISCYGCLDTCGPEIATNHSVRRIRPDDEAHPNAWLVRMVDDDRHRNRRAGHDVGPPPHRVPGGTHD